ncbi:MAG TPA: glycosyltransferase family 39 protein [Candidatus Acidoferrales bacterium]|nr:glycosyltransferase family 39 protein [Candidatus Acidoferrales bacterium]
MEERFSLLLFRISFVGIALGAAASFYFLAGLAGYVASLPANTIVALTFAGAAFFFLYEFNRTLWETNGLGRLIWFAIVLILISEVLLSMVPPTARDELTHHLAIPRLYVKAGRIIEFPIAPYSYYPMLLEMLYTPWVFWGYDSVPKLVHCLFGFLTGLLLYAYLSRRMNSVYGLLGFFFFISVPAVLRLDHLAYVDLGTTFYAAASLLSLMRWREEKDSLRWLFLAAVSAGFAASTKPNGLVALLLSSFLLVFMLAGDPLKGTKNVFALAFFAIAALLPFLPWLVKNWWQTSNPFFPLLGSVFTATGGGGGGSPGTFVNLDIFARRALLYGESWWEIAALPLRVFFSGRDDDPRYFDGVLSPMLILLLPWAFKGKWIEEKKLLLIFALFYFAYALFLADLRIRYILPVVPPLVVLFIYAVFNIYLSVKRPAYLFACLIFFASLHALYLWRQISDATPFGYLTGRESRDTYLERHLPDYRVFEAINRQLPPSAKIYLLFAGRRTYYCDRDYFHDGGELPGLLLSAIQSAKEPSQIGNILKTKGITHLMIREDLLAQFLRNNLNASQGILWNNFVSRHLQLRFRDRGYALYDFHA